MQHKPIRVRLARAIQSRLSFQSPSRPSLTWDRVPDVVKTRVVAHVLLEASRVAAAHEEGGDD